MTRKLLAGIVFLFLAVPLSTVAQKSSQLRLNVYTNYVFDDKVDSYYSSTAYYNGTIKGSFQWGVGLEYMFSPATGLEVTYLRQDTKAPTTYYDNTVIVDPIKTREFDLAMNYIFLGSTRYFKVSSVVEPFFGGQVGLAIVKVSNPTNGNENNTTKLGWGLKGGSNFWVADAVAIRLQMSLTSAVQAVGGGLYFGTGGAGAGLTSYSSLLPFGLGGGVVFRFGGN